MARLSADIDEQIDRAIANARDPYDYEVAVSAEYDRVHDLLLVNLKSGQRLAIPREDLQGLYGNKHWMKQLEQRRRENAAAALSRTA